MILAEAAHVLPPIGAQGLNTSLNDVRALIDILETSGADLGTPQQLDLYVKARAQDTKLRATAIDAFNRICKSGIPALQALRTAGLKSASDIGPLRRRIMAAGMGRDHF